jgi:hypothetical protein
MSQEFNEVADLSRYNSLMGRAIMDKLFFVDKVPADLIVDFGSADGLLIENLIPWYPSTTRFMGYDNCPEMNALAAKRCPSAFFTDDWAQIEKAIATIPGEKALVLSSVVHEVYHYSEVREIDTFWKRVFESGFDYIVLRDMIPSRSVDRPADMNDVAKVYRKFLRTFELKDFETNFGSIESNRNLLHFLLKYKYTSPNWAREVKENYFPLYREDLLAAIPYDYEILFEHHFVLPYLRQQVRKDFRIDIKDPLHLKLILQKEAK